MERMSQTGRGELLNLILRGRNECGAGRNLVDRGEGKVVVLGRDGEDTHLWAESAVSASSGTRNEYIRVRTVLVDPPPERQPWMATMVSPFLRMPSSSARARP